MYSALKQTDLLVAEERVDDGNGYCEETFALQYGNHHAHVVSLNGNNWSSFRKSSPHDCHARFANSFRRSVRVRGGSNLAAVIGQVRPSDSVPSTAAGVIGSGTVNQLLLTVKREMDLLLEMIYNIFWADQCTYLRATLFPVLMHFPNSTTAVAAKAQQLPQFPWFFTGCMQTCVR